ncbi:YphA family membrane protein [Oceanobacillus senegalensis]|uniref:YphA family membrane protein n=1 Tax=Oceanobacillus senegalensis TaxID=1936063 RepID=UPI000A308AEA|nr:hypothetical protein [Oceanobacillus senegalensis]
MEEGMLFFWFSWIFWILVTFFMNRGKLRTYLAYWILLSIIVSPFYVVIGQYFVHLTVIILLLGTMVLIAKQPRIPYYLFASFTVTIGYTALLLWEKISPIWLIIPRTLLIAVIIGCLVSILSSYFHSRISICLFGFLSGEIIYSLILYSYGFQEEIGEMQFLDTLLSTLLLLTIIDILYKGKTKLSRYVAKLQTKFEVAK